jgi:hypothetical protein
MHIIGQRDECVPDIMYNWTVYEQSSKLCDNVSYCRAVGGHRSHTEEEQEV